LSNTPSTPKNDWLRRFHLALSRLHYELMFMVPWGTWKCSNYGYAPVSPEVFDDPVGRHEPYQIELYNQVRKRIPEGLTADSLLCEVSFGRGGGLSFLKRSLGVRVVGLDRSFFGRLYA
jgi:hypothetical protein